MAKRKVPKVNLVRKIRKEQEQTLKEIAVSARISIGFLNKVERGVVGASPEVKGRIAYALDRPIDEIFPGKIAEVLEEPEGQTAEEEDELTRMKHVSRSPGPSGGLKATLKSPPEENVSGLAVAAARNRAKQMRKKGILPLKEKREAAVRLLPEEIVVPFENKVLDPEGARRDLERGALYHAKTKGSIGGHKLG